jgi:hypothetical protein
MTMWSTQCCYLEAIHAINLKISEKVGVHLYRDTKHIVVYVKHASDCVIIR